MRATRSLGPAFLTDAPKEPPMLLPAPNRCLLDFFGRLHCPRWRNSPQLKRGQSRETSKATDLMKNYGAKAAGTEESHAQVRSRSAIDGKAYGAHNVMG